MRASKATPPPCLLQTPVPIDSRYNLSVSRKCIILLTIYIFFFVGGHGPSVVEHSTAARSAHTSDQPPGSQSCRIICWYFKKNTLKLFKITYFSMRAYAFPRRFTSANFASGAKARHGRQHASENCCVSEIPISYRLAAAGIIMHIILFESN